MLKGAILGVLFLPALVVAQQQQGPVKVDKPVLCAVTESVLPEIYNKYKEVPVWGSKLQDSKIALLVNPATESWTIVQWNNDYACVLETGEGFFMRLPVEKIEGQKG
jgi:hypothetical protein